MVTLESLISQIKSLEMQLAAIKAQLEQLRGSPPVAPKSFADLYGIFKGKVSSSEEDIEAVEYSFEWEGEEMK